MPWIETNERLPNVIGGSFNVETSDGTILKAYFFRDKAHWLSFYGVKVSYWWTRRPTEPIHNVIKWYEKEKTELQ